MLTFETVTWRQHSLALFLSFMLLSLVLLFDQATRALQQLWFGGDPC